MAASMITPEMLAEFKARGKTVTRVAADATSGLTARDFYLAARAVRIDPTEERRVAAVDHMGRSIIVNGLGETIAVE